MRSWEIIEEGRGGYGEEYERGREDYPREEYRRSFGMRGGEAEEAYKQGYDQGYEEGYQHGYEKAMKTVKEKLEGSMGFRTEYGDRSGESYGRTGERRPMGMPEPGEMGERRRRSNGRWY